VRPASHHSASNTARLERFNDQHGALNDDDGLHPGKACLLIGLSSVHEAKIDQNHAHKMQGGLRRNEAPMQLALVRPATSYHQRSNAISAMQMKTYSRPDWN